MNRLHPGTCKHVDYRLSCVEFAQLSARAGDSCEICRRPRERAPGRKLYIDHDHDVGIWAVRGLLCPSCNVLLALRPGFKDQPESRSYLANPFHSAYAKGTQ